MSCCVGASTPASASLRSVSATETHCSAMPSLGFDLPGVMSQTPFDHPTIDHDPSSHVNSGWSSEIAIATLAASSVEHSMRNVGSPESVPARNASYVPRSASGSMPRAT